MEDVVSFYDKTIKETNTKINQTEGILKQQKRMNTRRLYLHQRKFPKRLTT